MKMMIDGMMCQHCAGKVRKALEALGCEVEVSLEEKCAKLSKTENIPQDAMKAAVEKAGFQVKGFSEN